MLETQVCQVSVIQWAYIIPWAHASISMFHQVSVIPCTTPLMMETHVCQVSVIHWAYRWYRLRFVKSVSYNEPIDDRDSGLSGQCHTMSLYNTVARASICFIKLVSYHARPRWWWRPMFVKLVSYNEPIDDRDSGLSSQCHTMSLYMLETQVCQVSVTQWAYIIPWARASISTFHHVSVIPCTNLLMMETQVCQVSVIQWAYRW